MIRRYVLAFVVLGSIGCDRVHVSVRPIDNAPFDANVGDVMREASLPLSRSWDSAIIVDSGDASVACTPGIPCTPTDSCRRGLTVCQDGFRSCESQGNPYVMAGAPCDNGACDGNGLCIACGGIGQPCCEGTCESGSSCATSGLCVSCESGMSCQPTSICRVGQMTCSTVSCEANGNRPRGSVCGSDSSCDGVGDCVSCGGANQPCCGGICGDGFACNAANTCFACTAGAACTIESACFTGAEVCADGMRSCRIGGVRTRGIDCGSGSACDGRGGCEACGGAGQPCCGSSCGMGLLCDGTTQTCFGCSDGEACVSMNGCRTGRTRTCDGVAQCVEDGSRSRGTSCGPGQACDGAGACATCGSVGQLCCGTSCSSGVCNTDNGRCEMACAAGSTCSSMDGCRTGVVRCDAGRRCELGTNAVAGAACGSDLACDGNGACVGCGAAGQMCCDGDCGASLLCASGMCSACPTGMVLIPGGFLDMGSESGEADESPVHRVFFPTFCADRTEVTVAAYGACASCSMRGASAGCTNVAAQPANCVNWAQADFNCRSRGARLPTEAEWEYLARGNGSEAYPWGTAEPSCSLATYACADGIAPIGSHAAQRFGLFDLAGNVAEWISDYYESAFYSALGAAGDQPQGPSSGTDRGVRGSSYLSNANALRSSNRDRLDPTLQTSGVGFRCVSSPATDMR